MEFQHFGMSVQPNERVASEWVRFRVGTLPDGRGRLFWWRTDVTRSPPTPRGDLVGGTSAWLVTRANHVLVPSTNPECICESWIYIYIYIYILCRYVCSMWILYVYMYICGHGSSRGLVNPATRARVWTMFYFLWWRHDDIYIYI